MRCCTILHGLTLFLRPRTSSLLTEDSSLLTRTTVRRSKVLWMSSEVSLYKCTHTHTHTYTQSHTYTHIHTDTVTDTHIHTHIHTHRHTHTRTHTHTHTHKHTHTHTHTRTNTHKQTQIHIYMHFRFWDGPILPEILRARKLNLRKAYVYALYRFNLRTELVWPFIKITWCYSESGEDKGARKKMSSLSVCAWLFTLMSS